VGLAHHHVNELHLVPPQRVQFLLRLDRAVGDRSGKGAKVQQHRLAA